MERRVIKFNLVGAISVLILTILIIVGIIVFAVKMNSNTSKGDKSNNNDTSSNQTIHEKEKVSTIDENKQYMEKVEINGTKRDIGMKICVGSLGYTMKYDFNTFYIQKNVEGKDEFKSLYSDTVNVTISKTDKDYTNEMKGNDQIFINGKQAFVKSESENDDQKSIYYIKANDGYFIIEANCGHGFADMMWPIMQRMIETFNVL